MDNTGARLILCLAPIYHHHIWLLGDQRSASSGIMNGRALNEPGTVELRRYTGRAAP